MSPSNRLSRRLLATTLACMCALAAQSPAYGAQAAANTKATITIGRVTVTQSAVLVTIKLSARGQLRVAGRGLVTAGGELWAGSHRLRLAFTTLGTTLLRQSASVELSVSLTTAAETVSSSKQIKL